MDRRVVIRGGVALLLAGASWAAAFKCQAQSPPPAAGAEVVEAVLPTDVQVVRLRVPEGVRVEVFGPAAEPWPLPNADPTLVGMRVGTSYRLRVFNIPNRPGVELYPVVQIVGHIHRPPAVDPGRFPIRINLSDLDLEDAMDRGRLVTEAVYLEDPEQALPLSLPKDEIAVATLTPLEDPAKVASALGRVVAIVRIGGRTPMPEEVPDPEALLNVAPRPCPFASGEGGRCPLPCGPVRGTAPPAGRPWLPRDEYLCDGGDRAEALHFGGDGNLQGIDPRDAVIQFRDDRRPRVLPTNVVCLYAPRFAAVRTSLGPVQAEAVQPLRGVDILERQVTGERLEGPERFVKNETAVINRHRSRASAVSERIVVFEAKELRILESFNVETRIGGHVQLEIVETRKQLMKGAIAKESTPPLTIKTAEGLVVTGLVQGAGQQVTSWKPQETAGVEVPPNKPGLAVLKRVSAGVAEPGDVVEYAIQYRNMGNVPITAVSVIDSLLPRLEYVARSAKGPAGTVFTAGENRVGGTELRWDLPGAIAPGQEGVVLFRAKVR